jgi:glycogen debranching enzyme
MRDHEPIVEADAPETNRAADPEREPGTPARTASIVDALVVKDGNVFFLTDHDGGVPLEDGHGLGLYYNDCRYLSGYELRVAGRRPCALAATAARGFMAVLQLNVPEITVAGRPRVPQEELGIKWERLVDRAGLALHDRLILENFGREPLTLPVKLSFRAGFEDVFAVRELAPDGGGVRLPPVWQGDALRFGYQGVDSVHRTLTISFSPAPQRTEDQAACFEVSLQPRERAQILVSLAVAESPPAGEIGPQVQRPPDLDRLEAVLQRASDTWVRHEASVRSDSLALIRIMERAFRDLYLLRSTIDDREFFAAGVPWFATLFGRDSLITAIQTLAFDPGIAAQTLRLLARYQGSVEDDWRDEQPGKILHELRMGEMARAGMIPHSPYYGTVDATPLFLILLGRHAEWTGDLGLFQELRAPVERALAWMTAYGDISGRGYLEYERRSEQGLDNQGWKDAHDAVVNADGSKATPPIALVEVQGYAYLARTLIARLYERTGDAERAALLRREAAALRERFNRDFWLEDRRFYALALQEGGEPAAAISSNAGHMLWTGIADDARVPAVAERLLEPDMFSGWGIRTLSSAERCYNPNGYHVGTVWPHDNAMIVAGLRRYGRDDAAQRIFMALLHAAMDFDQYRLPELFAGFPREEYGIPVPYPVACRPQAWAAGAVPYMLESTLGLVPEAFERRLRIVRPRLPDPAYSLELHGLRVGTATAALRFDRTGDGVSVRVLRIDGPLDVIVEGAGVRT